MHGDAGNAALPALLMIGLIGLAVVSFGVVWLVKPQPQAETPQVFQSDTESKIDQLVAQLGQVQERLDRLEKSAIARSEVSEPIDVRVAEGEPSAGSELAASEDSTDEGDRREGWGRGGFGRGDREVQELFAGAGTDSERLALAQELLQDDNPMVRYAALRTLAELSPAEAVTGVEELVASVGEDRRAGWVASRAISLLGEVEGVAVDSTLYRIYDSADEDLRMSAARALEEQGDAGLMRQEVASVTSDLGSDDGGLRARAVDQLAATRSPLAVPHLLPMLSDSNSEVRLRTLDALRRTGDESQIETIKALLDDPVAHVRERAARTMESLREGDDQDDDRGRRGDFFRGRR
jgi:hypothetical protein